MASRGRKRKSAPKLPPRDRYGRFLPKDPRKRRAALRTRVAPFLHPTNLIQTLARFARQHATVRGSAFSQHYTRQGRLLHSFVVDFKRPVNFDKLQAIVDAWRKVLSPRYRRLNVFKVRVQVMPPRHKPWWEIRNVSGIVPGKAAFEKVRLWIRDQRENPTYIPPLVFSLVFEGRTPGT